MKKENENYDVLMSNRFIISLPPALEIDDFEISSAVIERDKLLIKVRDNVKGALYNKFYNIEDLNKKIGDNKPIIEVCYLDRNGKTIRTERYMDVACTSISVYPKILNYKSDEALAYSLEFTFSERLSTDIRN